jgi:hypothetical protein
MAWTSDAQLEDFVLRFQERALSKTDWTHAAHLSVGAWHVRRYGVEEAVERLRQGIRALNDSHGTANTDSSGYHETITRAYAHLIAEFLALCPENCTLAQCVEALLASRLAHQNALLEYYSKELLMSIAARREWKGPDLKPLSGHCSET